MEAWVGMLPLKQAVQTDAKGAFTWENPPADPFTLRVSLPGYQTAALPVFQQPGPQRLNAVLLPETRLTFAVKCYRNGEPLTHGRVLMRSAGPDGPFEVQGVVNEGRSTLTLPAQGSDAEFRVESPGYTPATIRVALRAGDEIVKVTLKEAAAP